MKPQRLQLSRRKGSDLQAQSLALNGLPAVRVSRPGKWGNPFTIKAQAERLGLDAAAAQREAVGLYAQWVVAGTLPSDLSPGPPPSRAEIRAELGGRNLACWCKPGTPCHADILIDIANS